MLQITIPAKEWFDDETNRFQNVRARTLMLEHSLLSISKWEAKWHKSYMNTEGLTNEENLYYIKCMCIDPNVDMLTLSSIPYDEQVRIKEYLENSMTATTFSDRSNNGRSIRREIVTSELIYYWMIYYNIPFECEKWHINRLLTLIKICGIKERPREKMNKKENIALRRAANQARRLKTGSRG